MFWATPIIRGVENRWIRGSGSARISRLGRMTVQSRTVDGGMIAARDGRCMRNGLVMRTRSLVTVDRSI